MRKYTADEHSKYWVARCFECGWRGLTCDCGGFGEIGDTGDYADGTCPRCDSVVMGSKFETNRWFLWLWRFVTIWPRRRRRAEERAIDAYIRAHGFVPEDD